MLQGSSEIHEQQHYKPLHCVWAKQIFEYTHQVCAWLNVWLRGQRSTCVCPISVKGAVVVFECFRGDWRQPLVIWGSNKKNASPLCSFTASTFYCCLSRRWGFCVRMPCGYWLHAGCTVLPRQVGLHAFPRCHVKGRGGESCIPVLFTQPLNVIAVEAPFDVHHYLSDIRKLNQQVRHRSLLAAVATCGCCGAEQQGLQPSLCTCWMTVKQQAYWVSNYSVASTARGKS